MLKTYTSPIALRLTQIIKHGIKHISLKSSLFPDKKANLLSTLSLISSSTCSQRKCLIFPTSHHEPKLESNSEYFFVKMAFLSVSISSLCYRVQFPCEIICLSTFCKFPAVKRFAGKLHELARERPRDCSNPCTRH